MASLYRVICALLFASLAWVAAASPVELRFVVWDGDEALGVLRKVVNDFEKVHPEIHVRLENADYKIYFQKLLAQYAANVAPDVAMMDPQNYQRYAKRGALAKLDPFLSDDPSIKIGDYYSQIVEALRWKKDLYVLPRDVAPIGIIYYNKRLFKGAGLDLPDGSWTWDYEPRPELGSHCFTYCMQKLTKKDASGKVIQWGFAPSWTGALTDTIAFSSGAKYVDDPEAFTKTNFTDPRVIKAFDWVAELSTKRNWMPNQTELTSVSQTSALEAFISQRVAMYQCGIWDVPHVRDSMKPGSEQFFDWDITLAPGHIDKATGKVIRAAPTGGSGYGMLSSTQHPREAWLLMKWMAGEPGMTAMAKAGIAQPAIQKLAQGRDWIPGPNTPVEQQYPHNRIVTDQAVQYAVFPPTAEYWMEISGLVFSKTEPIYVGSRTAKDALTEGEKIGDDRLRAILNEGKLPLFNWRSGIIIGVIILAALGFWVYGPEIGVKRTNAEKAESRVGYAFILPWVVGMLVFTLGPMVLSILMSTANWDIIQPAQWRGIGNYREAFFEDPRFWNSLRVTGVFTLVSVPLGIVLALLLALLLNTKVRGMAIYRTCFYLPALASAVASALIWRKIFQPDGGILNMILFGADGQRNWLGLQSWLGTNGHLPNWLGDERLALPALIIKSVWGCGGAMIILLAGLQGISNTYYEAATLDGAGPWHKFKNVTIPLLSPSLFFTLITGVIGSFQVLVEAFVMTGGGPNDATRFYMLHLYENAFGSLRMGYASALAWILFVAILMVTLLQFRLNKLVYYGDNA